MSKSPSQMNKKELYELCKKLQEELNKEKLFNNESDVGKLNDEIHFLKEDKKNIETNDGIICVRTNMGAIPRIF